MCVPLSESKLRRGLARRRMRQQNGLCLICEQPMGDDVCIDHVWPRALSGPNQSHNKALTHTACNAAKGDKMPSLEVLNRFVRWCHVDLPRKWFREAA